MQIAHLSGKAPRLLDAVLELLLALCDPGRESRLAVMRVDVRLANGSRACYSPNHQFTNLPIFERKAGWRRGWDSNPRAGYPTTRFRGEAERPYCSRPLVGAA